MVNKSCYTPDVFSKINICLLILLLFFINNGCKSSQTISQGVTGKVLWFEGNLMPGPDKNRNPGRPIQRDIYFYAPTRASQCGKVNGVFYKDVRTKLIRKVTASEEGAFQVKLDPGTYSVFVADPNGLFASRFDENGIINPVKVLEGQVTSIVLRINYKAAY